MLGKLIKYDLKGIIRPLSVFYILGVTFSVLARIFNEVQNSIIFQVVGKITTVIATCIIISSLLFCLVQLWARFERGLFKDEAYLTHTLPVKIQTIYASKCIVGLISTVTTMVIALLSLIIGYYSEENLQAVRSSLELTAGIYDTTVVRLLLLVAFVSLLEAVFIMLVGYAGIVLGYRSNKNKNIRSVTIGVGLYLAMQVLTLGIVFVIGLFQPEVMNLIKTVNFGMDPVWAIKLLMYAGIGIYIVYSIGYYILGEKVLEKGVNVD